MISVIQRGIMFIIKSIARILRIDLLPLAYHNIGILKYESFDKSGEKRFIQTELIKFLQKPQGYVFFDVGANIGNMSMMLRDIFPDAEIWAFEPNQFTYDELEKKASGTQIKCYNLGFGDTCKTDVLYLPVSNQTSSSASTNKDLFHDFYQNDNIVKISFEMQTIDAFCFEHNILSIDFLKIDTEGNELFVLNGASRMLSENRIKVIQFEFGECHVFSRTFLRDFYKLLSAFQFFRLDSRRLIPLGDYHVRNEIFRFQNIIAIQSNVIADRLL